MRDFPPVTTSSNPSPFTSPAPADEDPSPFQDGWSAGPLGEPGKTSEPFSEQPTTMSLNASPSKSPAPTVHPNVVYSSSRGFPSPVLTHAGDVASPWREPR